jgi:hypothetical protein
VELYQEPPFDIWKELWAWLGHSVAVQLTSENDRYVMLLRALDAPDPKQWWWRYDDTIELGLAVDVLGEGIPRPRSRRAAEGATGEPYPFAVEPTMLSACFLASEALRRGEAGRLDARYVAICDDLVGLRQKANGEPYGLPWFMFIYRAWQAMAAQLPGFLSSSEDSTDAERELRFALFALGIGTQPNEVPAFLNAFARLPWTASSNPIVTADERTVAFIVLVYHLAQSALARGQRMRLQHPVSSCFVSYARPDEGVARELVAFLEAKGTSSLSRSKGSCRQESVHCRPPRRAASNPPFPTVRMRSHSRSRVSSGRQRNSSAG